MNWTKHLTLVVVALAVSMSAWGLEVSPAVVPMSDPEIPNPGRGFYAKSLDNPWVPASVYPKMYDRYIRNYWNDLEAGKDTWTFSVYSDALSAARSANARLGFRVNCLWAQSKEADKACGLPDYIVSNSKNASDTYGQGLWVSGHERTTHNFFVPAYNNENFLTRVEALSANLGKAFGGTYGGPSVNRSLGWVEIGIYGNTGEWHPAFKDTNEPTISIPNAQRIIDSYVAAFPDTQLLFRQNHGQYHGLALESPADMGMRYDGFGSGNADVQRVLVGDWAYTPKAFDLVVHRWKTAPMVTEHGGTHNDFGEFDPNRDSQWEYYPATLAYESRLFHIAMVGNDCRSAWGELNASQQTAYMNEIKKLGYRINLTHVKTDKDTVAAGSALPIASDWTNVGLTPTYERWDVTWELRDAKTGAVAASTVSKMDFQKLVPVPDPPVSASATDTVNVGKDVAAGEYNLYLVIRHPYRAENNLPNLKLATKGLNSENELLVGPIHVSEQ